MSNKDQSSFVALLFPRAMRKDSPQDSLHSKEEWVRGSLSSWDESLKYSPSSVEGSGNPSFSWEGQSSRAGFRGYRANEQTSL